MSPENTQLTPEQQNEKPYVLKAQEVIVEASSNAPQTEARFQAVDTYIAEVLEAADAGEITGSKGVYTKEDMLLQFGDFLNLAGKSEEERKGVDPFAYIPSANGLRSAFRLLMDNDATYRDMQTSLKMHLPEERIEADVEGISRPELITSKVVMREMGGASLKAVGIEEPQSPDKQSVEGSAPEEPETEVEMYERFVREGKAELDELYRQHRNAEVGSSEWASLENQIKLAKEDVGANARRAAQLKGNRWT